MNVFKPKKRNTALEDAELALEQDCIKKALVDFLANNLKDAKTLILVWGNQDGDIDMAVAGKEVSECEFLGVLSRAGHKILTEGIPQ